MTENKEFELLSDIAKLIKKYDVETFKKLAGELSDPDFVKMLTQILVASGNIAGSLSQRKKQQKSRTKKDFYFTLTDLKEFDQEKGELLLQFYEALILKNLMPTLREIKSFSQDAGFPEIKATSREKAVVALVKYLISMPLEELKNFLNNIPQIKNYNDRSLEGWSKIILNPRRELE